jgi:hypothetical protein
MNWDLNQIVKFKTDVSNHFFLNAGCIKTETEKWNILGTSAYGNCLKQKQKNNERGGWRKKRGDWIQEVKL